jgi:hypothetical protein
MIERLIFLELKFVDKGEILIDSPGTYLGLVKCSKYPRTRKKIVWPRLCLSFSHDIENKDGLSV